jgi:hypothetical protein
VIAVDDLELANADGSWTYEETAAGVEALGRLAWGEVLHQAEWTGFARSLFADIADGLGEDLPFPGRAAFVTWQPGREGVLRNV